MRPQMIISVSHYIWKDVAVSIQIRLYTMNSNSTYTTPALGSSCWLILRTYKDQWLVLYSINTVHRNIRPDKLQAMLCDKISRLKLETAKVKILIKLNQLSNWCFCQIVVEHLTVQIYKQRTCTPVRISRNFAKVL